MAGHLLQLKLQSIRNGARRDSQHRGAWIGTLLFSILIAVFAVLAVVSMLDSDIEAKREGAIIVGSLATITTGLVSVFVTPIAAIDPRSWPSWASRPAAPRGLRSARRLSACLRLRSRSSSWLGFSCGPAMGLGCSWASSGRR